jgi:hypothetical protein
LPAAVSEKARAILLEDLTAAEAAGDLPGDALMIVRRDEHETLLSGHLPNSLSGLSASERLGPFVALGGINVWFDVFAAARRVEVREAGASVPALVISQAQPPVSGPPPAVIAIEPGTVWIRADLLGGGFPAAAFIGVKVSGGTLEMGQPVTVTGDVVETAAPFTGILRLNPAPGAATPVDGACTSAGTTLALPDTLTFTFAPGGASTGGDGKAQAWGQPFEFTASTGGWTFVEQLWMAVLGYDVNPRQLDAGPIGADLVRFSGMGSVQDAGLGLPVVVATDPAILGQDATAAGWLLRVSGLTARWYNPDPRIHPLGGAWVSISAAGAVIMAEAVAPLSPPVTHTYDLWTIAGGGTQRLPWHQTYGAPFLLLYGCYVAEGEYLVARGQAAVALDRPVTTNGVPVPVPAGQGQLLLRRFGGEVTVTAVVGFTAGGAPATLHQFALRNALVWTTAPLFIFLQGALADARQVNAGNISLRFGITGWAPTLPDPYVANGVIRGPREAQAAPQSQLVCRVTWAAPENVVVSFEGELGSALALGLRPASGGEPRPARRSEGDPDVGLTQFGQHRLTFERQELQTWKSAQAKEEDGRGKRSEIARQQDQESLGTLDKYTREAVGPPPGLLLLDVSTNQDLLGVAFGGPSIRHDNNGTAMVSGRFPVSNLEVSAPVADMRVVALPQVQWEPVRTLDDDQDIMTMGWFPTPLASATDGGATHIGARSQKLMPIIPEAALKGTFQAYQDESVPVSIRTTFPFGLIGTIQLQPQPVGERKPDLYGLTRPAFPGGQSVGGIQITAQAEGGRPDEGGVSPSFEGRMRQLHNGVDLSSGATLGISVLGSTADPAGSVETIFNTNMAAQPRVPVTRVDLSGYGGSNFSDWNNPFAAFADAAKVQFRYMIGRTALEVIKVNSVWHPWGVRMTRSVTIERRPGGGVVRRDSGWQAFTPGIFDYRYADLGAGGAIVVAPYVFDAGVFRGLFNVRNIRPAPGAVFSHGAAKLVPYYADADVALEGVTGRTAGTGILGYLQTEPSGLPADADAIRALLEAQGPVGGPIDAWMNFGGSGLPFRAQRVEVGLAMDGPNPLFVATVRGVPKLPETGAWSVVVRPVASVPANGGEAVPVAGNRGVPVIRRYPVKYLPGDTASYQAPLLDGTPGDYRFADAADLLTPAAPVHDYGLIQSTPTHAFLFPRPFVPAASAPRLECGHRAALADIFARSTSKGAFPAPGNTIELGAGSLHLKVSPAGKLALSAPVSVVGHPTPLRMAGTTGHGSSLFYDRATLNLELEENHWAAEFSGLRIWSDIAGLEAVSGAEIRIVGATTQRPQITEIKSLMLQEIEDILRYIPIFGERGVQGPIDLGATNAKHELKLDITSKVTIPKKTALAAFPAGTGITLTLYQKASSGFDLATGGAKASGALGAELEGRTPPSGGVGGVFLVIAGNIEFSLTSLSGAVTSEKLDLLAFVGVGVAGKIGGFEAYAFLGIGFVLSYDAIAATTRYGGIVALEAGVDLKVVKIKIRADLKGLVYKDAGSTKCDYSGSVKLQVEVCVFFSINVTYQITETTTF